MNCGEGGCGCPKALPAAQSLAVGAVGPLAAATPLVSDQSYAATGCEAMAAEEFLGWTR